MIFLTSPLTGIRFLFSCYCFFLSSLYPRGGATGETSINFSGIRSAKGQIIVKVYTNNKAFQDDKPLKVMKYKKSHLLKGSMTVKIRLEPGVYGMALLDDEDNNGEMDYNFIGYPLEGFGFSDFYLKGLKKPIFDDFKFEIRANQEKLIQMKLRYL